MKYLSTRGQAPPHSFSDAVRVGLAPDGGLFVPEALPDLSGKLPHWEGLSYPELCLAFFRRFATDIPEAALEEAVERSYGRFEREDCAVLAPLDERLAVLELFHGPTLAFKDFALQLLGSLYERQVAVGGRPITALGATSGDTGAAAISGLLGKEGTRVFILYPEGRISPLQERQMACTGAGNVFPMAIEGSFDDAQAALKKVFADRAFCERVGLSAVNSINIARILAQCVYYLYAWLRLPADRRERVVFVVPTGNFGNVLSGWLAARMGMRAAGFRVATNQNDILHRFFRTGRYAAERVAPSLAPAMDIQAASNFERFLYYGFGEDAEATRRAMEGLARTGRYQGDPAALFPGMSSSRMDDAGIVEAIAYVYRKHGYIVDPHTACAFAGLEEFERAVVLATAHPAKFPDAIRAAIGQDCRHPALEDLKSRPVEKSLVSPDPDAIKAFIDSKVP